MWKRWKQRRRTKRILRAWRQEVREANLQLLPIRLLLKSQCQGSEAFAAAVAERTGWFRAALRLWRRTVRRTGFARSVSGLARRWIPLRYRHAWWTRWIRLRRKVQIRGLVILVWMLRQCLGRPKT